MNHCCIFVCFPHLSVSSLHFCYLLWKISRYIHSSVHPFNHTPIHPLFLSFTKVTCSISHLLQIFIKSSDAFCRLESSALYEDDDDGDDDAAAAVDDDDTDDDDDDYDDDFHYRCSRWVVLREGWLHQRLRSLVHDSNKKRSHWNLLRLVQSTTGCTGKLIEMIDLIKCLTDLRSE